MNFLPSIGLSGLWTLKSPFDQLLSPTTVYECIAIESLDRVHLNNINPFEEYYEPIGAEEAEYQADLQAGAFIITIVSGDEESISFPSTALVRWPDTDGVVYRNLALTISLSALPDSFDLTNLEDEIKALVLSKTGTDNEVYITQVGGVTVLPREVSESIENVRLSRIDPENNLAAKNAELRQKLIDLTNKLNKLEAYVAQALT